MRLDASELEELKKGKPIKVWRWGEPEHCAVGRRYSTKGEEYTVMDVRVLGMGALFRHFPKDYEVLKGMVSAGQEVWMVVCVRGDHTDKPRLMQPSGRRSGDYTADPHRAMQGEPEALTEADLGPFVREAATARENRRERREKERSRKRKERAVRNELGRAR